MGFLAELLKVLFQDSSLEQDQVDKCWHGVPIQDLSQLAQTTRHGKKVEIDKDGFLVFYYTSNSGKTRYHVQCTLNENNELVHMPIQYPSGQWHDSSDEFVEKANQTFTFC